MKSGLNVNQGTNKMEAVVLKDELGQVKSELLKSQAQVKGLRGVLGEVLNGYLESTPHDVGFNWVDWSPKAQQAPYLRYPRHVW